MYNNNNIPNDPSVAGRITMDQAYSNLQQGLNMYRPSDQMSLPHTENNHSQYNMGFNIHEHPRDLSIPTKMSDENPYERNTEKYKNIIRRKRYIISSLHKVQGTNWEFTINTQESLKDVRYIRLIKGTINYTATATPILNGYVYFPNFTNAEFISNNNNYHGFIPIIQGSNGTDVLFSYVFSDDYLTEFKNLDTVKNQMRVLVYKENSTNGNTELFTELNSFSIEIEFGFIDQAYNLEKEIKR